MKKDILIFALLLLLCALLVPLGNAQIGNVVMLTGNGAPSGACPNSNTQYTDLTNKNVYGCAAGSWFQIGGTTGGSVTSVGSGAGLSGGPITTSGSLTLDLTHANTWTGQQTGSGFTNLFASPPAIGGTSAAAGSFTTLAASGNFTSNITGGGTQCVHVSNTGVLSGTGSDCGSGGGGGTFAGLTPGTNTSTTPFSVAPGSVVGGTTANFSFLGPASDTNTAPVVNIDTGASSTQPSFRVGVQGNDAFKIIEITGPNQQTIQGTCAATPNTSTDVARQVMCTTSAGITALRQLNTNAAFTGTGIQAESVTGSGSGFKLFSGRVGCSTDGTCGSGTEVFNVVGNGTINGSVFNAATGFQINSAAPSNHVPCGNGTNYVDCTTLNISAIPTIPLTQLATQAADTVMMNATGAVASPTAISLAGLGGTNGCAGISNALTYNTTTHAWGCNSSTGSGTVNSGTANQVAYYASSGTAVSSDATLADNGTTLTYTGTSVAAPAYTGTSNNGGLVGTEGTGVNATFGAGLSGFYWDSSNNHGMHADYNNTDIGILVGGGNASVTSGDIPSYSGTNQYQIGDSGIGATTIVTAASAAGGAGQFPVSTGSTHATTFRVLAVADLPISGTAPIAISGGGAISITGAAGQVLAGASPAFTATPTLGTDNSVAGTLQLANGSSNAHTIWGSGATTSNTIKGFTVAPTTGDLVSCTTASTICTLTDAGFLAANAVRKDTTNTGAAAMTLDMSASTTGNALKIPSQAGLSSNGTSSIAYDTTGKLFHVPTNGADSSALAETTITTTAGKIPLSTATGGIYAVADFPERFYIPAANCNNTTAGAGWSIGSGGTVVCRAGTNNLGGAIQITDISSTFAQFTVMIPEDWDTGTNPYIRFYVSAVSDTTNGHTIIPQIKVSCPTAGGGTVSDDATFSAAQSSSTITFGASAVANGFYNGSNVQIGSTQMTGCIAGGMMIVQVGRATDTATGNVNFWGVGLTFPRLLTVQAN